MWISAIFYVSGVLSVIGVLGWQAYEFLRNGVWIPISVIDGLRELGMVWRKRCQVYLSLRTAVAKK